MRSIKTFGLMLVAVCATAAIAATGASAHNFTGSSPSLLVLAKKDVGLQVFKTLAGTLECENVEGHGSTPAGTTKTESQTVTTKYTGCVATGALGLTAKPDEPITTEYEFNANGTVRILKTVTILATLTGGKCTITVPAQGPLGGIAYTNPNNKEVLVSANVSGIETSQVGAGCVEGTVTAKATNGTYVGNSIVSADAGGSIQWE